MSNYVRVTGVLAAMGFVDTRWFTELGRDRGSAVHAACEYDDAGDLDETTVDPMVLPYLEGWRKFRKHAQPRWTAIEKRVSNETWRYTGTPDRVGTIGGKHVVVDIKSGAKDSWHRLQLAAYQGCMEDPFRFERWVVRLTGAGKFSLDTYTLATYQPDFSVFCSAVNVYRWLKAEGKAE